MLKSLNSWDRLYVEKSNQTTVSCSSQEVISWASDFLVLFVVEITIVSTSEGCYKS